MQIPQTSTLSKLIAAFSCVALVLYIVGFASPYWLEQDFIIPAAMTRGIDISVEASMGLLTACQDLTYPNGQTEEDCSSDGAADWQKIAAGFGIAGLVLAVVGVVLAVLRVLVKKVAGKDKLRIVITVLFFVTAGLMITDLILYAINKKIQVKKNLPLEIDFDFSWAFTISAVAGSFFAVLVLLCVIDIIWSQSNNVSAADPVASSGPRTYIP